MFWTELAPYLEFGLNSHAELRCLGGGELVYTLFDEVFVDWICVERLVESETRLAQALIGGLPLVFVLGEDPADPLALFGREAELLDRICGPERFNGILRLRLANENRSYKSYRTYRTYMRENQHYRQQDCASELHLHLID
ncbi:MAG TPA: hypothetical protein VFR78_10495 [Pyrinomonadaceae bacterium]|nr:hypothetical protein [Pyrinomonadaceae bacterium]